MSTFPNIIWIVKFTKNLIWFSLSKFWLFPENLIKFFIYFCFSTKGNLDQHKLIHEGVTYKCETCHKDFTQKGTLKTHIRIVHGGEKNFKCDMCDKVFSQSGNLNSHLRTVHKREIGKFMKIYLSTVNIPIVRSRSVRIPL